MCPWKTFEWPGSLSSQPWALSYPREEGRTPYSYMCWSWSAPWPFQNTSVDSFLEQTPVHILDSLPHAKDSVLPHLLCATWEPFGPSHPCLLSWSSAHSFPRNCTSRHLPSPSLRSIWLHHQLHSPQVIQKRQAESKPCDTDTNTSLSLLLLSNGTQRYQKGAGMGYHTDTAHISSANYKQENLWGGCGQFPETALVFLCSWCCTSGSPSRLEQRQHAAAWGLLWAWAWIPRSQEMQRLLESSTKAVPDELGPPCREQTPDPHSPWKKTKQTKDLKGEKFPTNHTFPAVPTNCAQEIYLCF